MKKIFITCSFYDPSSMHDRLFQQYHLPRVRTFCKNHNFKSIEANYTSFNLPPIFNQLTSSNRTNTQFARFYIIKKGLEHGTLKDGDIVNYVDSDVFIAQPQLPFETKKSITYAIDSGNTHCTGVFSLKINKFTRKLIDEILSQDNFNKLYGKQFNSDNGVKVCDTDQSIYYILAGIKLHSWVSFLEMPDYGFHSSVTDSTIFSKQELLDNVELVGPEWNTTHLTEETGNNGAPNYYDIVKIEKDRVINRHFAGGQSWLCSEWEDYSKKYA